MPIDKGGLRWAAGVAFSSLVLGSLSHLLLTLVPVTLNMESAYLFYPLWTICQNHAIVSPAFKEGGSEGVVFKMESTTSLKMYET